MTITNSQSVATAITIKKIAYYTAQGKGQRAKDAIVHCAELGIDHTAKTFEAAQ